MKYRVTKCGEKFAVEFKDWIPFWRLVSYHSVYEDAIKEIEKLIRHNKEDGVVLYET